ncbi:hypothetical protein NBE98_02355 [Clostridium swellfunianum]|uniref:hypothetical protein n=1 Tax=Clostridium swellfunianum TaxID=1367462 RepID=UPI00202FED17|nr:hypothetical protein [Clostridium swellfunianum]MCM0647215.1 hypothetical protein [Clostridium swellfunianum]
MEHKNFNIMQEENSITLEMLMKTVMEKTISPQDYYEIAAILESLGWNDSRAAESFGAADIFELSQIIWDRIHNNASIHPFSEDIKDSLKVKTMTVIKSFLRGLIFSLPMAISVLAMLTLRFSLWSYQYLSTELSTSIAIGTILSFMSVGGFTQVIARRGFFYINQGFYNMAKRTTYYFVRLGYIVCIIVALLFIILNLFYEYIPFQMMFFAAIYYIFLSSNWLSITVTYLLKRELTFTGILSFGIFLVYILFRVLNLDIILSQIIALLIISITSLILIIYFFNKDEKLMEKGIAPPMPRKSVMLYSLKPFFYYGFLYFTFLYIDRILAWSTTGDYMPYIIWFRGDYELGLDFALLMLMLPMGISEVTVSRLMESLELAQKNSSSNEASNVNQKYISFYLRNLLLVFFSAIISSVIIYLLVMYINNGSSSIFQSSYAFSNITYFVFVCALVGYSILAVALSNVVILFSLSQSTVVTKVMLYSILANFLTGFVLSRWFGFYFAVFGLLVGSIVFCLGTFYYVIKVLKKLDYYLYCAL